MENLNKEEMKLWIEALRSGNYLQGKGSLQSKEGYCCLGVACKVLIPEDKQEFYLDGSLVGLVPSDQSNSPEWLKNIDEDFMKKMGAKLSILNDNRDKTFLEIADLLEKTYLID